MLQFSASSNVSTSGQNAPATVTISVLHIMTWLSTTASKSIRVAFQCLAKRNAFKGGLSALVSQVIASIRFARISA